MAFDRPSLYRRDHVNQVVAHVVGSRRLPSGLSADGQVGRGSRPGCPSTHRWRPEIGVRCCTSPGETLASFVTWGTPPGLTVTSMVTVAELSAATVGRLTVTTRR